MEQINVEDQLDPENIEDVEDQLEHENIEELNEMPKKELKNKKLITLGECSKFYFNILGDVACKFVSIFIIGGLEKIGVFGFYPILKSYDAMQSIYTYIGYIIFGTIFYFCFRGKKKINENNNSNDLIYAEGLSMERSKKTYFQIFLVCFCFGLYLEIQNLFYGLGFQYLNFWAIGTIFTFLLMKKYFPFLIFRHHKLAIIFITITCMTFILICSILPESSSEKKLNTYQKVEEEFGSYYYCILIIVIFIGVNIIYAYSINYFKVLIQFKNMNLHLLIIFSGIIGLIISIIFSLIFPNLSDKYDIFKYFSELKSSDKFYIEIFVVYPIFIFSKFMQMYLEMLLIYFLNPFYVLWANDLTYGISKLISFISNKYANYENFLFSELAEVSALLGNIIFLEIIELNFCGLSENIRRNIKLKGELDFRTTLTEPEGGINIEENKEKNQNNDMEVYEKKLLRKL